MVHGRNRVELDTRYRPRRDHHPSEWGCSQPAIAGEVSTAHGGWNPAPSIPQLDRIAPLRAGTSAYRVRAVKTYVRQCSFFMSTTRGASIALLMTLPGMNESIQRETQ